MLLVAVITVDRDRMMGGGQTTPSSSRRGGLGIWPSAITRMSRIRGEKMGLLWISISIIGTIYNEYTSSYVCASV